MIAVGYTVHTLTHMALGLFKYVVEQILSNLTRRKKWDVGLLEGLIIYTTSLNAQCLALWIGTVKLSGAILAVEFTILIPFLFTFYCQHSARHLGGSEALCLCSMPFFKKSDFSSCPLPVLQEPKSKWILLPLKINKVSHCILRKSSCILCTNVNKQNVFSP